MRRTMHTFAYPHSIFDHRSSIMVWWLCVNHVVMIACCCTSLTIMMLIIVCAASELKMCNFFFPTSFTSHTPRFLRCFLRLRVLGSQRGHRTLQGLEWIPTLPTLPTLPFGYTTTYRPFWFLIVWARNYFRVWRVVGPGRTCHEIQNGGNLKNNFRLSDPPESYETPVYNQRNGVFLRCEICMALGPWGLWVPEKQKGWERKKSDSHGSGKDPDTNRGFVCNLAARLALGSEQ